MTKHPSFDDALATLAAEAESSHDAGIMDGIWERAGRLEAIVDGRRRAALFAGLFVVGLSSGVATTTLPGNAGSAYQIALNDFGASARLSPTALLEGRR